jgi:hypothetical protein
MKCATRTCTCTDALCAARCAVRCALRPVTCDLWPRPRQRRRAADWRARPYKAPVPANKNERNTHLQYFLVSGDREAVSYLRTHIRRTVANPRKAPRATTETPRTNTTRGEAVFASPPFAIFEDLQESASAPSLLETPHFALRLRTRHGLRC